MWAIVFPSCSGTCVRRPTVFPRWFAVLDTLTTCPLLVTTGVWSWTVSYCRVSAVASLWWSVTSPSLQVQVPMVQTVQCTTWPDVLVMHSCRSHRCGLCFGVFSPVPGAGPFLSCTTSWSTLFRFRVGFFAQHRDSRRLWCRWWCPRLCPWSFWFATGHVHALTQHDVSL